jgi:hypothetical protein
MLKNRSGRVVCGFALLMPIYSYGALITGSTLNFGGNFNVGATFLNWNCVEPGDTKCAPTPPVGAGDFAVAPSTLTFAQYNGTFGLITDLNNTAQPLNTPISLPNFMTFDLNNNETITLTFIPLGTNPQSPTCAGLPDCTPSQIPGLINPVTNPTGASAFNLDGNATGTAAAFSVEGTITDTTTNQTGTVTGIFTSQLDGVNPQGALAAFAAAGPSGLALDYSGQLIINTVVPEPVTLALTGAVLLGLGLFRKRRRRV